MGVIVVLVAGSVAAVGLLVLDDVVAVAVVGGVPLGLRSDHTPLRS